MNEDHRRPVRTVGDLINALEADPPPRDLPDRRSQNRRERPGLCVAAQYSRGVPAGAHRGVCSRRIGASQWGTRHGSALQHGRV